MSATVITIGHLIGRIGTDSEMTRDRKHATALLTWRFNCEWRLAEEAGDTDKLAHLAQQHERLNSL